MLLGVGSLVRTLVPVTRCLPGPLPNEGEALLADMAAREQLRTSHAKQWHKEGDQLEILEGILADRVVLGEQESEYGIRNKGVVKDGGGMLMCL